MSWRDLDRGQRRVLTCTLTANALVFFDQTAVTVALPAISRQFSAGGVHLQWVITAYLLALAVFMLIAGRLADRVGRRRTFVAGLVIFAVGSVLCAAAPNLPWLIAARFLQGIGGAVVQPLALSTTTRVVGTAQRGWAIGALAAGGTAFLVFGPLIAGALLLASWRWIFVAALPAVLFAIVAARAIEPTKDPAAKAIAWGPVLLLLVSLISIVFGLVSGADIGLWTLVPAIGGLGLLALFLRLQVTSTLPLIDLLLLGDKMLATSLAALFAIQFAVFGVTVYLALYLQHRVGLSSLAAGAVIAVAGIGTPLLSPRTGKIAGRVGPRRLVVPGLALAAGALVLVGVAAPDGGVLLLLSGLLLFALARPAVFTPAGVGTFLGFRGGQRAFVASLATEARQLGAVIGVAMVTAVGLLAGGGSIEPGDPALGFGFRAASLVAAGVCALTALAAWRWMPAPVGERPDG